ncbi:UDP-N-acetylmuramate dehydrogenase [Desulfonatronospira sp.]|uniref:UDP-N-acetylmuramate dehydrogenase n=1 Tax=Desulfonatronospira sp. TaxID=1962951 RepID=UPI0025C15037|nr:UDP-N-acetylmuramate dehydrogenase [Desulfonatronospira sp.]
MKKLHHPDLKKMSTLKMGGRAGAIYYPEQESHLEKLSGIIGSDQRCMFLGRGSNVLFTDNTADLVLIKWHGNLQPEISAREGEHILVNVDAGFPLPRLLGWSASRGLSGLEGLAGIPGSVGGAVVMNAGSHGVDFCSLLSRVWIWTPAAGLQCLQPEEFSHGYREFKINTLPGEFLVTAALISLTPSSPEVVQENIKKFYLRKKKVQPVLAATAGCVFKNPPNGESAGRLLDQAGFRGKKSGQTAFSTKHANFLVNLGNGTSLQALALIQEAREKVKQVSGHELQLEIRII